VEDFGLVLTGTLRNVSERTYRTEDGEKRTKIVAVVDTGRDWLVEVSIRRDDVPGVVRALEPLKGETVSMEVSNGHYRSLWFEGLR